MLLDAIKERAKAGYTFIETSQVDFVNFREALEELGYKVDLYSHRDDTPFTKISWGQV